MAKKIRIFVLFLILSAIFKYGYKVYMVSGDSMNPSMTDKSLLLVKKRSYDFENPKLGDIVVLYDFEEDDFLIKRVLAIAGDSVEIIDGIIFINDEIHNDIFSHDIIGVYSESSGLAIAWSDEPLIIVPEGYIWVIGDNRRDTWYGIVSIHDVVGGL